MFAVPHVEGRKGFSAHHRKDFNYIDTTFVKVVKAKVPQCGDLGE